MSGKGMDRATFLRCSLATGVVMWAGSQVPRGLIGEAEAQELFRVKGVRPATFPQSVASGDPQPDGIVLWTRIDSLNAGTTVAYEIARDTTFRNVVLRGKAQTSAGRDNTVKVQIQDRPELKSLTTYYYRFIYNGFASRTGRFKTLPAPNASVDRVRFGYISCQDFTNGYYTALAYLAEENVDFIVHLGDYIYETVDDASFQNGQVRRITLPNDGADPKEADTLEDYRFLYKKYKADQNLQRVHERFAFITIWDDHEFANDCYLTTAPDAQATQGSPVPKRREAANRAWAEYSPVGVDGPVTEQVLYEPAKGPVDEIKIFRAFVFGDLLELVMTDERLFRDGPPAGNALQDRYLTPGGKGEKRRDRTILGEPPDGSVRRSGQKRYFLNKMLGSSRVWKIWGNEVTFMQFKVLNSSLDLFEGTPIGGPVVPDSNSDGVYVTLDQWDGYQAERDQIIDLVAENGVKNFVTITGDIHTFIAGYVRQNFDAPALPQGASEANTPPPPDAVGVEFVCGSITSSNLTEIATFGRGRARIGEPESAQREDISRALVSSNNRHFKYFNSDTHGYNLMEVTKEKLTCTFKNVDTIKTPRSTAGTLKVFEVPEGESPPRIIDVTPVSAIPSP